MSKMVKAGEKFPQVGGKLATFLNNEVNQAGVDIFSISWGHHMIMDRNVIVSEQKK